MGYFPNLEPVEASTVGETQNVVVRVGHKKLVHPIVFFGRRCLLATTTAFLRMLITDSEFRRGEVHTGFVADFMNRNAAIISRLGDGLPHIAYLATAFSTNADIEPGVSDAWRLFLCLTHSRKPVVSGAFTEHGVGRMAEMMQLFRRDRADLIARPLSIFTITATGMFRYSEDSCQNLLDCVECGDRFENLPQTHGPIILRTNVRVNRMALIDTLRKESSFDRSARLSGADPRGSTGGHLVPIAVGCGCDHHRARVNHQCQGFQ